ncbi:MAG: hypothetical protein WC378_20240 [Opitutaceae bacterium]|jgi:hypothetical protein
MNAQLVKIRLRLPFAAVHINSGEVEVELYADQLAEALGNLSDLSGPHGKTADELADLVILSSISNRRIEACANLLRVSIDETDGAEWEPAAVEAIARAAEKVCQVAGINPGLHEAAVHRMRRASGLALGGAA